MPKRIVRKVQPSPEQQAKASKNMDAYVSRPSEDSAATTETAAAATPCSATGEGTTLDKMAAELKAIRESTSNIEKDTKQIKTTVSDIEGKINSLTARMDEVEDRVATLEETTGTSEQQLTAIQEEMQKLQNRIEDLDNRGRRCNIKILGLPESAEGNDMIKFLQREIPVMLGWEREAHTLEMQRAHRVPAGPPGRDRGESERPRPVMINLLRYQDKEQILRAAREKRQISWQGAEIMFFPDYSRQTMDRRKLFKQVKADLRGKGVEYSLRFPATLEIKRNGAKHRFSSPEEAAKFVKKMFPQDK